MAMDKKQREKLIRLYADGPKRLAQALRKVPAGARAWRPAPGKWSVHEVVVHCADSETNAAGRVRYALAEKEPLIVGYDQDLWSQAFDYARHPLAAALATVRAVRANTLPILRRVPEEAWGRRGRHTEIGEYTPEIWLETYAAHLEIHARQIERNLAQWNQWKAARGSASRPRRRQAKPRARSSKRP